MTDEVRARRFYLITKFFWARIDESEVTLAFGAPLTELRCWNVSSQNQTSVGTHSRSVDIMLEFRQLNQHLFDSETLEMVDQAIAGLSLKNSEV